MKQEAIECPEWAIDGARVAKYKMLHFIDGYWVSDEGSKNSHSYHVWVPSDSNTHSKSDSAYKDITLAVARCNYLAARANS